MNYRRSSLSRTLYTPTGDTPERTLVKRVLAIFLLLVLALGFVWFDREGIKDNLDGELSFTDAMYFTMITVMTVGYGDIVPVSDRARTIDTFFLTPIRIVIWFIFVGTAYQLVVQRVVEDYRMSKLQRRLSGHIVICGYGHTGRNAAKELVAKGQPSDQIVVIDGAEHAVQEAADAGFVALRGDATREQVLMQAGVEKARAVIVSPGRDDTAVLTVLTIRQLTRTARVIVSVKVEENSKLIKQGGADLIVSPSRVGGYMLADAIDRAYTVEYLYDLMTAGGQVNLVERAPRPEEFGHQGRTLADGLLVRIHRGDQCIGFWEAEKTRLAAGDVLLVIGRAENGRA